ncbi:uncharacterized protein A4U43_C09F1030 [Asparagus officinalis]|uniref:Noroxomaritidine/norcraugsodine reductase n=1 Tax=Asparagus officinalis TaxID=4686 RepID=A0A5P1E4U0_ASPOF|nr:momilactone A synthase-like isoform X2 [Asparagus officinalis]ONK57489.1 uncharacterized protein A4U43_C09F1030 [Asparagus officinalis]
MSLPNGNAPSPASGKRLEGKVAIITGGAAGIGAATAKLYCHHGAKVVIADIKDDLGRALCADISYDDNVTFVHCDVSNESDVKNAVDFTLAKYGKLDIMFNNAGVIDKPCNKIMDAELSEFERAITVNCTGVFLGTKHAARAMVAAGTKGSIINNGSVCTVVGGMAPYGYVAAKHGALGVTKNAAAELGQYGIRVNCISPFLIASPMSKGFFETEGGSIEDWICGMANLKRGAVLKAEDIAQAAVYFGSDESKYVSGHNFVVDGGFTAVNNSFGLFKQEA